VPPFLYLSLRFLYDGGVVPARPVGWNSDSSRWVGSIVCHLYKRNGLTKDTRRFVPISENQHGTFVPVSVTHGKLNRAEGDSSNIGAEI
jgi:hypothetical protein